MADTRPYKAVITREQFWFYEMREVAKLMKEGLPDDEIIEKAQDENIFQYPTERMIKRTAAACLRRLHGLENMELISAVASPSTDTAKQVCLYAYMLDSRLIWEFMITVIGNKYRLLDTSFGRIDVNTFMMRLQEQDDTVASWSENTIQRIKQTIMRTLVETEYIDSNKTDHLNNVLISPELENAIREQGRTEALPAFNCFS